MPIMIHNKEYRTVAERLNEAHTAKDIKSITTEVLPSDSNIVIKATVVTQKGVFTGISASNPSKAIEKVSPYEVAETSAVGRALAFAGYAGTEIASADELVKAIEGTDDKANMYQIIEIRKLFKELNIPFEKQKDAVEKAGATKLEELTKERANFILTKLREKRDGIQN